MTCDFSLYRAGRPSNLLKPVERPLGATFDLTYAYIGNTFDMPNGTWALDSVIVFDAKVGDGVDHLLTTFALKAVSTIAVNVNFSDLHV